MPMLNEKVNFNMLDEELQKLMLKGAHADNDVYKACLDILLLRHHERLINKTGELVNETKDLVRKTWWVARATWAVAGFTIVAIIVQLFGLK
jgi:hypothetical protein